MNRVKEPVRLRMRETTDGGQSLYLDIYTQGKRRYEYLHLYLLPERTKKDRDKNKDTLAFAETIRAKRVVEMRNGIYGFRDTSKGGKEYLFDYYEEQVGRYRGGSHDTWAASLRYLHLYEKKNITLDEITHEWCQGFRDYLDKQPLVQNTKVLYLSHLRAILARAHKEEIIASNPMRSVKGFRSVEVERSFLTVEEVKRLSATPIANDMVRRAFLFACLTGLRWSDIKTLSWAEVQQQGQYTRIVFKQQKTKGLEYLDVNSQAVALMGTRSEGVVFGGLCSAVRANVAIRAWVKAAGIDKHITFHCARHTFAVMMLDIGVDIYTVSKLLGHRELSTTQIYAKVLDKNKRRAVEKIPTIL